jgi:hypothetical protein
MRRPGVHVNDNELDDLRVNVSQLVLCAARFGKDGEKSQDSMKSIPVVCQGGSSCTQRHVIAGRLRS